MRPFEDSAFHPILDYYATLPLCTRLNSGYCSVYEYTSTLIGHGSSKEWLRKTPIYRSWVQYSIIYFGQSLGVYTDVIENPAGKMSTYVGGVTRSKVTEGALGGLFARLWDYFRFIANFLHARLVGGPTKQVSFHIRAYIRKYESKH
jgi:hypothetical protein